MLFTITFYAITVFGTFGVYIIEDTMDSLQACETKAERITNQLRARPEILYANIECKYSGESI